MLDKFNHTTLAGVNVSLLPANRGTVTDSTGHFSIGKLASGPYILRFEHIGYKKAERRISLSSDLQVSVALEETVIILEPLEITPGSVQINNDISTTSLSSDEVLATPNFGKDVFRSLQVLPNVANTDWSSRIHIRGGNPDETAFIVDGLQIYEPYHLDELDGPFGILSTETIRDISILPGGYSAKWPDKMSGMIRVQTVDEIQDHHLQAAVDFLTASAYLNKEIRPNLLHFMSARRGYIDAFTGSHSAIRPVYYDIWNKFLYRSNPRNTWSFNFLYSHDNIKYSEDLAYTKNESFHSQGHKLNGWINWDWFPTPRFVSKTTVGGQELSKNSTFTFESSLTDGNIDDRHTRILTFQNDSYWQFAQGHMAGLGLQVQKHFSSYIYRETRVDQLISRPGAIITDSVNIDSKFKGHSVSFYAEDTWEMFPKTAVQFGVRMTKETFSQKWLTAPRCNVRQSVNERITVKFAYGWYYQPDSFYRLGAADNQTVPDSRAQKSIHYAASVQYNEQKNRTWTADLFVKDYPRLLDDAVSDFGNRMAGLGLIDPVFQTQEGVSKGLEVAVRQLYREKNLLNVSYAFGISRIRNNGSETARDKDRRHALAVHHLMYITRTLSLSSIWRYHSGDPYTPSSAGIIGDSTIANSLIYYVPGDKNSRRLPNFQTLDIKIEKVWKVRDAFLSGYINFFNILGHKNVRQKVWKIRYSNNRVTDIRQGDQGFFPRLLSIGIGLKI